MLDLAVLLSLVVAFLSGASVALDKVLMTDFIDETPTIVLTSMVSTFVVTLLVVLILQPNIVPTEASLPYIIAAGLLKALPLFIYFRAIRAEDSTVVATVTNSGPFLTVILAFIVLGERLAIEQYLGVGLLVAGIVMLGVLEGESSISVSRGVALAVLVTLLFSGQNVLYKLALERASFWAVVFPVHAIAAFIGLLGLVDRRTRSELMSILRRDDREAAAGILLSETISSISAIIKFAALSIGFVSIVTPVSAVSHLFVFLIVGVLSILGIRVDTPTSRREWGYRILVGLLVFVGILLVS